MRLPSFKGWLFRPKRNTYLFLPINGAGLGHLTRSLAIAKRLQEREPDAEIVFLTTSIGVTLVHRAGFTCHHVTPAALLKVGAVTWNRLFFKTIENVLAVHRPKVLVFDGTMPYLGLRRAMHSYWAIDYVWIKRGLYKQNVDSSKVDSATKRFAAVIEPGELKDDEAPKRLLGKVFSVGPISLMDESELLEKRIAKQLLRLVEDKPCAYVQLGAGNINGIEDVQGRIVKHLHKQGIQVVLGQSPIAINPKANLSADSVIVDYPNSKYFNAFDFAVLAGGYNSVCEAVVLGLPAIFVPNTETGADDQERRVREACEFGSYEVMLEFSEEVFSELVGRMLRRGRKSISLPRENGAVDSAKLLARY